MQLAQKQAVNFGYKTVNFMKLLTCSKNGAIIKITESEVRKMKPLTINVDTSALDEAEEKVSRLLSLLKEAKEIIGSLKVED